MKRRPELQDLSRDHHEALAVALRLKRAGDADADEVRARLHEYLERIGDDHFDVEEELLLAPLRESETGAVMADRICAEHRELRALAAAAPDAPAAQLHELGGALERHVRFEEREVFPYLEQHMEPAALAQLGRELSAHVSERGPRPAST